MPSRREAGVPPGGPPTPKPKRRRRACFDWCPHGTFNPRGCGACAARREPIERAEQLERNVRLAVGALLDPVTGDCTVCESRVNRDCSACTAIMHLTGVGISDGAA